MHMTEAHLSEDQVQGQFSRDGVSVISSFPSRFQVLPFLLMSHLDSASLWPIPSSTSRHSVREGGCTYCRNCF